MKKRLGILSAVLVAALVFVVMLALFASAEPATEATLTVKDAAGTTTTLTGSYDEMVEALNSSVATLGEGSATLKLTANAVATEAILLTGTGAETVSIDLAGYTLDVSAAGSAPIFVSAVKEFSINGGYNTKGIKGSVVSTASEQTVISTGDSEQASSYEIVDLYISYASSGYSAIAHSDDDELILRNVDITWAPTAGDAATKIIESGAGSLTLINSEIADASPSGISYGIVATGTTVRLENTGIAADYVYMMNGVTWLTAVDATLDASAAIFTASNPLDDIVICAGVTLKGNILGGAATADMIKLYYGTGSTVIDRDPTGSVTIATSLATLGQLDSGKWTLESTKTSHTITTQIFDRGDITEEHVDIAAAAATSTAVCESKNVVTIAAVADRSISTLAINLFSSTSNGKTSTFLDFNGYTYTETRAAHFFSANGLFRLSMDGADAEGKVGGTKNTGYVGGAIYVSKADAKSVYTLKNINITNTNGCGRVKTKIATGEVDDDSANMMQIQSCRMYVDGANFIYTGEDFGRGVTLGEDANGTYSYQYHYSSKQTFQMLYTQSTAFVTLENSSFTAEAKGAIVEKNIPSVPIAMGATANDCVIYARNCTYDVGVAGNANAKTSAHVYMSDCSITAATAAFNGAGNIAITASDCVVTLREGAKLAAGKVNILTGDGKMKVFTADGAAPTGNYTLETGSAFYFDSVSEGYIIVTGDDVTTVRLNKLFDDGMVFQAGKPINVWGTCNTDGATIQVTLGGNTATATVAGGKWDVTLPAMEYAKGLTLTITEVGMPIGDTVFKNVDIGEVWAFSGQSNANLGAYKMEDFEEYKALADLYNIRLFSVQADLTSDVLPDAKGADWFQITSENVGMTDTGLGLSAVGYVMATRLAVELEGSPTIAIVDINYNGKAISNFISNEFDPYEGFSSGYHTTHADAAHQIYNSMIAPFEGYNIRGFGWYQGEATYDSGECDADGDGNYGLNVDQLYATYTKTFNKNAGNAPLELFIVQLSAYMGNPSFIRAYQEDIASRNEHYHVISSSFAGSTLSDKDFKLDAGNGFQHSQVHAARKSPLGLAMADSILENVYFKDQNLDIANPEVESVVIEGAAVKVTLDRDFTLMFGTAVEGFEISADGSTWVKASGTIDGRTITLTASGVTAPKYVRYGWGYSVIELETGEKLVFHKGDDSITYTADPASDKATTVTIVANGKTYTINTKDTEVLRSMLNGNVIATNGHTLHVFSTAIVSSSAGNN